MKLVKRFEILNHSIETEIALAPCPFCFEQSDLHLDEGPKDYYVRCGCCQCLGPNGVDEESCIIQWNTRGESGNC